VYFGEQVRRYYDDNTRLFLSLGQGTEGTIHRALWGPGVTDRVGAMAYVDTLVMDRLRTIEAPGRPLGVADLGCGVCASLCRIAKHMPIQGVGITISRKQAEFAERRIEAEGFAGSVRCVVGDFCDLPSGLPEVDLAFGIESFVHAPNAQAFFENCARLVRPGGYLIVCDDLLGGPQYRTDRRVRGWLERFRKGWLAGNLVTEEEANQLANRAGFRHVETRDLTPYIEMSRPRDYWVGALMRGFGWLPIKGNYWGMLYGGHAGQICLKRGWVKHLFLIWQRQ
jgi:SAM-dependent methyltransferase